MEAGATSRTIWPWKSVSNRGSLFNLLDQLTLGHLALFLGKPWVALP